jgi:phenylacetic acid degradation operon negative regulatory protein
VNTGLGGKLLRTKLTFSADDSRRLAGELWDLDGIAALYRQAIAEFDDRVAEARQQPPGGAAALRAFAGAVLPLYRAASGDPDLPAELLPPDWPVLRLSDAIGRAFGFFVPLVSDYLEQFGPSSSPRPVPATSTSLPGGH